MKSYTELRNLYGVDTKNTNTANLSYGDQMMNDFHRRLLAKADWPFLHKLRTVSSVAATAFVNLPYDVDLVESVYVMVGTTRYNPKPVPNREFWDKLFYSTVNSDIPQYWYVFNGQIGIWPLQVSNGNTIALNCKIRAIDLNIADITGSTITTLANGSTALTVSSGLTVQMAGMWIRPTYSTTANTGDGLWYEIASVQSATAATLVRAYGGQSISGGTAACTIAQMPLLPEAYQDLPEQYAAYRYWSKEKDDRSDTFKAMVADGVSNLFKSYGVNDLSMVLDDGEPRNILNPNLTITL